MASNSNKESSLQERIFLGIGSNRGKRHTFVERAVESLSSFNFDVVSTSSIYETEPVGLPVETEPFLNLCVEGRSESSPRELMDNLLKLERNLGRQRTSSTRNRRIDLDLLLFGQRRVEQSDLKIPHPRMQQRRFVLKPLSEIAPNVIHPTLDQSIAELLKELADDSTVDICHSRKLSPGSQGTPK